MSNEVRVVLALIAVVALIGNTLTIILFVKKSKWLKKAHNCLILALSIQDILVAICLLVLPSFVQAQDSYPVPSGRTARNLYCSIVWSHYVPFSLGVTSVYTCLMLTVDRWLAVVKPMSYKRYEQSPKVICIMVVFPWIAGFFFEISSPINAVPVKKNDSFTCEWDKIGKAFGRISIAVVSFLGMIVVPAMLMMAAYLHIILHMKRSRSRISVFDINSSNAGSNGGFSALKRVTLTAFFASTIVVVCWLPDQLYYALSQVDVTVLGNTAHSVVKILAFANSCINPFIYSFSNSAYRKGFKEIVFSGCVTREPGNNFSMEE